MSIDLLVARLGARENTSTVQNPYRVPILAANLRAYLSFYRSQPVDALLVGEAPGYRGCALTGIPFTSPRLVKTCSHPFFEIHRANIWVDTDVAEAAATAVWSVLSSTWGRIVLWNIFPFHPHRAGLLQSNRAPTGAERNEGSAYLRELIHLVRPRLMVGIGALGHRGLSALFPDLAIHRVRHPSYGGAALFKSQLETILASQSLNPLSEDSDEDAKAKRYADI